MGTITTKYSVGDKVYIVTSRGLEAYFNVKLEEITGINIGGRYWETYELKSYGTRGEKEIFINLEAAKKEAKKKVRECYERNVKDIEETTLGEVEIQS